MGLEEPMHFFDNTLFTPITSITARMALPAIIPVPSGAGLIRHFWRLHVAPPDNRMLQRCAP